MIKILIVDDNIGKVRKIREVIEEIPEFKALEELHSVPDLASARASLEKTQYDLMLLDLQLPNRYGEDPSPDSGIKFLNELTRILRLKKPIHIIGLTAYDDLLEIHKEEFSNFSWHLIKYEENATRWRTQIKIKIEHILNSKRESLSYSLPSQFDLAIITALSHTELEAVLRLDANWESFTVPSDSTEYNKGVFKKDGKRVSVVAACAPQMGMAASAVLTTKMIQHFRPKYMAMTGIAAALPGKANFGDILVTELSFDSGSGKISTDKETQKSKFLPDYRTIDLDVDLKELVIACIRKRDYLESIQVSWPAEKPSTLLTVHLGPIGSGSGVIENEQFVEEIRGHSRKLLGVDMETYGVFYASSNCSKPRPLAVLSFKSVSDFANPDKNDAYQKYAAYTSAMYLYHFALDKLPLE